MRENKREMKSKKVPEKKDSEEVKINKGRGSGKKGDRKDRTNG